MPESPRSLFLFGPPRLEWAGGLPVELGRRKAFALLAYLAVERRPHSREALAVLLWPDEPASTARSELRRMLSAIGRAFGPGILDTDREQVRLAGGDSVWVDVEEFRRELALTRMHGHRPAEVCGECLRPLNSAVRLARGAFLEGFSVAEAADFDHWQALTGEALGRELAQALHRLALCLQRFWVEESETALRHVQRWLALDGLNEVAYRLMMSLHVERGEANEALRLYDQCRAALRRELAVEPSADTTALYEQIRAGKYRQTYAVESIAAPVLPRPLTSLIGRDTELAALLRLLSQPGTRLVTLTGAGGIGKTRLALAAAEHAKELFADGVYFVDLAGLGEASLVTAAIARAVNVREAAHQALEDRLTEYLESKHLLLVLDNFEHVIAAAAGVVRLLERCPRLAALITSRSLLRVRGECEFSVPPLSLPEESGPVAPERLHDYAAPNLFVRRVQAINPQFYVTPANAPLVAEICRRLEGLPLAIELAAARAKVLTPEAMLLRLERRLEFLRDGPRDLPARQRTLRRTIEWSHDLLDEGAQTLFRRLSVFAGGWTLDAAEAVCGLREGVYAQVQVLLDSSLLVPAGGAAQPRFRLLDTLREFAAERLAASGEHEAIHQRHAKYYRRQVSLATSELHSPALLAQLHRLEVEIDNLRAAFNWLNAARDGEAALGLSADLVWFWQYRGRLTEGRQWLASALAAGANEPQSARAQALWATGYLAWAQGDMPAAQATLKQSADLAGATGDERNLAYALCLLGMVHLSQGEFAGGETSHGPMELIEQARAMLARLGDRWGEAFALAWLGTGTQDPAAAQAAFGASLALFRDLGDPWGTAIALSSLGTVTQAAGDYATAQRYFEDSAAFLRAMDDQWALAWTLAELGDTLLRQGDWPVARLVFAESLAIGQKTMSPISLVLSLAGLGKTALAEAAQLFGAASALRERFQFDAWQVARLSDDTSFDALKRVLGDTFNLAWKSGQAMSLEEAVALGLASQVSATSGR